MTRRTTTADLGSSEEYNNRGVALQSMNRHEEAIASFRKACELSPNYVLALVNQGSALASLGRHHEAITVYHRALSIDPDDLSALNNLGASLHSIGQSKEARIKLEDLLLRAPGFVAAKINLAMVLSATGQNRLAIDHYKAVLGLNPTNLSVYLNLAELVHKEGLHREAINYYRLAATIRSDSAAAHAGQAIVLQELGEIDAARAHFRLAIDCDPRCPKYYLCLVHITQLDESDPYLTKLLLLAKDIDALSHDEAIDLHFALGKALADIGKPTQGFEHIVKGNHMKRRNLVYDEGRVLQLHRQIRKTFTAELMRTPCQGEHPSDVPVFIVGMPRSGSTLIEQILASHPCVAAVGETDIFRQTLRASTTYIGPWSFPRSVPDFSPSQREQLARDYLDRLQALVPPFTESTRIERITNKMLGNFRYIGLIHQLFPNSKIIHIYRDPIDTCISCFSIQFGRQPFSYDLAELGRHYRSYWGLMKHWQRILPDGRILNIRYRDVIEQFDSCARAIIGYCGLQWTDACLHFYATQRLVRTASVEQVRRPLYRSSLRRWRPDDQALRPLLEGLGLVR